jgi:hypothetical protein
MVLSRLNADIEYTEKRGIENIDSAKKVTIYNGTIFDKNIQFVTGNINYKYESKKVLYFNIYIVTKENNGVTFIKVGIYELHMDELETILDNEGEINATSMDAFIPFSYLKNILDSIE